jgi:hypothetical protein
MPVRAGHTSAIRSARRRGRRKRESGARRVEPLRVVDDADEGFTFGDLGEQRQRRASHQERTGCRAGVPTEHRREGGALRRRQPVEVAEHRRAELMEAPERELHLRLDADGRRDVAAGGTL